MRAAGGVADVSAHRTPRRRLRPRTVVAAGALLLMLGLAALAGSWYATGGRWLVVQTPSMGTAAPVGTLLWVAPVDGRDVHVGEVISFHPPQLPNITYTHRVRAIAANGEITTKGDANPAADPWTLQPGDVTGRVAARWWGVGWLVHAGPLLVLGGLLLVILVRRFTAVRWRVPAATMGVAVLGTLAIWIYRPLIRAELVLFQHVGHSVARATYVSTGLLPARVSAPGSHAIVLHSGEFGSVLATSTDRHGRFTAQVTPHLSWWAWVVLVLVCFLPALWSAARGVPPERAAVRG